MLLHTKFIVQIDSTLVRVHQQAAGGKGGGRIRRWGVPEMGLTTKFHMVCDTRGRPLRFILTAGQRHDCLTGHPGSEMLMTSFDAIGAA